MDKHMILYRGSLKSCNYHCSYCPFSKHSMSERELEKDRIQWFSFVESVQRKAEAMHIGALMVVPYGEAMIHSWYWQGLAYLSAQAEIDAVGIQTNLSFSIHDFLHWFENAGGVLRNDICVRIFNEVQKACGKRCSALCRKCWRARKSECFACLKTSAACLKRKQKRYLFLGEQDGRSASVLYTRGACRLFGD